MEEEFCHVDQWAAEAYLTALDAAESAYLDLLAKGIKIHKWLLERIQERFPEECKKALFDYDDAKQFVHSLNYGAEPAKMSRESGLVLYACQWAYDFYHGTFPRIKYRQQRIAHELETSKFLVSILGRKRIFLAPRSHELLNKGYAWPSQSVIGELTNIAITKIYYFGRVLCDPWMFPALNTHDGTAIRILRGTREKVIERVSQAFNIPLTKYGMTVVIPIEIGFGNSFNECTDKVIIRYPNGNNKS